MKDGSARYCEYEGCTKLYFSAGLCQMHHTRRRKGKPLDGPPKRAPHGEFTHGTVYGGRERKCPCTPCRQAASEYWSRLARERREKTSTKVPGPSVKPEARGLWTEDRGTTTLCWPPRDAGPDWKCPHHQEDHS